MKKLGVSGFDLTHSLCEKAPVTKHAFIADCRGHALNAREALGNDYLIEPVTLLSGWHMVGNCEPFPSGYMGVRQDMFRLEDNLAQRGTPGNGLKTRGKDIIYKK